MKKLTLIFLMLLPGYLLSADPTDARNHGTNPVFLTNSPRGNVELAITPEFLVQNSYMSVFQAWDLRTQKTLELDFGKIVTELGPSGLQFMGDTNVGHHLSLKVGKLGLAVFTGQENFMASTLPTSLFSLFDSGWKLDVPVSGKSDVYLQSFVKAGLNFSWNLEKTYLFGLYNLENHVVGGKLGVFTPLLFADQASFEYNFLASSTGSLSLKAGADFGVYTSLPVEELKTSTGELNFGKLTDSMITKALTSSLGLYTDLGIAYRDPKSGKMMYGASLLNFPLLPAMAKSKFQMTYQVEAKVDNLLGNYENLQDAMVLTPKDPQPEFSASSGEMAVLMPLTMAGFYRLNLLPILSVVGDGALVMPMYSPAKVKLRGTADLNLVRILDVTLGLGTEYSMGRNQHFSLWALDAGLSLNLYAAELGLNISLTGPTPLKLGQGVAGGLHVAVGF